jgi:CBS domain-containing membrane protein
VRADLQTWRTALRPGPIRYKKAEFLRGGFGALIGIGLAALTAKAIPGGPATLPYIVAPMGAAAVLLFAAPASPLVQPWSLLVGNLSSTLVGVTAGKLIPDLALAAAVAVAGAIVVMMALRCVHPPGGACALFAAVAGAAVAQHGYAFALWPVGVNTVVLLIVAALVNNLTGRRRPRTAPTSRPASGSACGPRTSGTPWPASTAGWTSIPAT